MLASLEVTGSECMFDRGQAVPTNTVITGIVRHFLFLFLWFWFFFSLKASFSKGSHFCLGLILVVFFSLFQKLYPHLNLLPSVLVSEVTALET